MILDLINSEIFNTLFAVGIVVFLLVEKIVRYVEERSGGIDSWGHGHHHHHHKKTESLQDINGDDVGKISETSGETSLLRKVYN